MRSILWTDHANLTRAQVGDVDVKLLRWVSELVADGSEIRSLALLDQRAKDLKGLSGQLRGFDLDEFLGSDTGTDKVVPWTVGDDAVPDRSDRVNAVSWSFPTRQKAAVVYVHDYRPEKEERQALTNLAEVLKKLLPGMETGLYSAYGMVLSRMTLGFSVTSMARECFWRSRNVLRGFVSTSSPP